MKKYITLAIVLLVGLFVGCKAEGVRVGTTEADATTPVVAASVSASASAVVVDAAPPQVAASTTPVASASTKVPATVVAPAKSK